MSNADAKAESQRGTNPKAAADEAPPPFEHWAIVEIMGHRRLAGRVTEERIAGVAMLRVDVPAAKDAPAFTTYVGAQSIFSLTPVSELIARAKAAEWAVRPVTIFKSDLQQSLTYEPDPDYEEADDDVHHYLNDEDG